jgi:CRP/FNR family transcriptional regulator, cyclic AMP receptor protein
MLTLVGSEALLDVDSDLGSALAPDAFARARETVRVSLLRFDETEVGGKWGDGTPHLAGLLLVSGSLLREVRAARRVTAELLGPGDVIRPFEEDGEEDLPVRTEIRWRPVQPVQLAVIDRRVLAAASQFPEITAAIVARAVRRSQRQSVNLSISHMVRIADRLLLFFWHMATHWGRVTPDGVVVDVPLTHGQLALLIGSERPSVSTALGKLERDGLIKRLENRTCVLNGPIPDDISELLSKTHPIGERPSAAPAH